MPPKRQVASEQAVIAGEHYPSLPLSDLDGLFRLPQSDSKTPADAKLWLPGLIVCVSMIVASGLSYLKNPTFDLYTWSIIGILTVPAWTILYTVGSSQRLTIIVASWFVWSIKTRQVDAWKDVCIHHDDKMAEVEALKYNQQARASQALISATSRTSVPSRSEYAVEQSLEGSRATFIDRIAMRALSQTWDILHEQGLDKPGKMVRFPNGITCPLSQRALGHNHKAVENRLMTPGLRDGVQAPAIAWYDSEVKSWTLNLKSYTKETALSTLTGVFVSEGNIVDQRKAS